jgi:hypothetical protein
VLAVTISVSRSCYFVAMKYLRGTLLSAAAALVLPAAAWAQAATTSVGGEVMFVSGKAERIGQNGTVNPVNKGMQLLEGDRIKTQPDSHVYVRMRDGGLLVVRPASELHVDIWRFDPSRPQDSQIKYTLDNGVARHVSGQGAKAAREKFRFNTPMAAIGVRGTDFTVLADASVTRVSVQSGGVVMNSFGDGCRADALGPCEGPSAVELFARRDKLLQLRVGERRPQLIEDTSSSPDRARPPAATEPIAKQPGGPADMRLADSRGGELVAGQVPQTSTGTPLPPPVEPTSPPPPPPPPLPDLPVAVWGRWAALSDTEPAVVTAKDVLNGRVNMMINRLYVLGVNPAMIAMALPGDGVGRFALTAHEGVITDSFTGRSTTAVASDAQLSIDFGARRFETSMKVSTNNVSTQIGGKGSVDSDGTFVSDIASSSTIKGVVGGKDAGEAMYLYDRLFNNDRYRATGATSWRK